MNLHRLERHQHPKPPHQELRQKSVFDSGSRNVGQVGNLYVDEDGNLRFLDVCTSGFLGFGKTHYLVPAEAIAEESPGAVTLRVDQQAVESAPTLSDARTVPDEALQRAAREHYGLGSVL